MRVVIRHKIRLVNISIRHKCTSVGGQNPEYNKSSKKIVRLKKHNAFSNNEVLTSVHSMNNIVETKRTSYKKIKHESTVPNYLYVPQSIKSGNHKTRHEIFHPCTAKIEYNAPEIPVHFEDGFSRLFYKPNTEGQKNAKDEIKVTTGTIESNTRVNEINMQMVSKTLHNQLFKNGKKQVPLEKEVLNSIKKNLRSYGINTEDASRIPEVNVQIPSLEGQGIEEHFYNIAKGQIAPYLKIVNQLINVIPTVPTKWLFKEGWTKYTKDGAESIDYPVEDGLILDVEVCVKEGPLPTLATAVSSNAWYGWISQSLIENSSSVFDTYSITTDMLIPVESKPTEHGKKLNSFQKQPKILVGHNVSYDRSRVKEQYWLNQTGTRFIDTMSLHVCVSGINSYQRAILKSEKESNEENWHHNTSLNNLSDIHKLYCGEEVDKLQRDVFIEGSLADIREQFDALMSYCALDVIATHNVLRTLFPMFQERFPHPVTFAGMLELGSAYLPVNSNWQRYLEESESAYEDSNYEAKIILGRRANEVCRLLHGEKYKEDLWMWDEDWSTQTIKTKKIAEAKYNKLIQEKEDKKDTTDFQKYLTDGEDEEDPLEEEFSYINKTEKLLPKVMPHMPGYPAWYRKLCPKQNSEDWQPGPQNISTTLQVVPKLLNLTWENYPLHYIKEHGWGILVPYNNDLNIETKVPLKQLLAQCPLSKSGIYRDEIDYAWFTLTKDVEDDLCKQEFWRSKKKKHSVKDDIGYKGTGVWCNVDIDGCCYFFKLPHKDGANCNVGNPLAKDFLNKFSENVLAGLDASASEVLKIARTLSYWRNNRDRIMSQLVIWFENDQLYTGARKTKKYMRYGAILPQVIVCGTLTRRAVERTWMTASNAHVERIGSELRGMVQAPPGYNIVGADVDSQELWIASMIGDAHSKKIHGATPFGWMTLIGTKSNGTDMHSITAKAVGISRDHAKIINYARIYGAGQKFAERLLKQFNPSMTEAEAASKSRKMFALTKGKKVFRLNPEYVSNELEDKAYTLGEACKIAKLYGKKVGEVFGKSEWEGGSESAMFNRLEEIARSPEPVTPFLHSRLSRALEGEQNNNDKYLPTKINWVVQSGAVDFLHLMLVSMRWLMRDNARFCLSFHDEVRYIVPSRYKYNAALAMHITNLLTRSFCAVRVGMNDLPMSVAFFTAVEVDTVLRKESTHDCKTPSNPHGLESGYGIPPGESLDVWTAIEKSQGSLGPWHETKKKSNSS